MPRGKRTAPVAVEQSAAAEQQLDDDRRPLDSVDIDSLSGERLKRYAKRAGIRQADIDFLSEDRLRQNTKLAIANHFDLLTE